LTLPIRQCYCPVGIPDAFFVSGQFRVAHLDSTLASVHISTTPHIPVFEKREELLRILESRYFCNSPKKTRFLEFVSDQTLQGNGEKLNEYLIGVEVYDRGVDFSPQRDPIVRVQAHKIRGLLKKYYEEEGKESPLRMELPSGHYVPQFTRNADQDIEHELPGDPLPAQETKSNQLGWAAALFLALVCLGLFVYIWLNRQSSQARVQPVSLTDNLDWFWHPFLPPAEPPLITIPNHPLLRAAHDGDSAQTFAGGHEIPKSSFPEFRDTIHFHELKRFVFVPSLTDFTSVGETLGLVELCQMFSSVGQKCQVQQSRLVNLDEIKADNAILLGGNQAWSGRVFLNVEGFHFQSGVIVNRNPQPGELPVYKPEFDSVTNHLTRDYALVLLLPNETRDKRVLLIYGIYTQGSQAALEYLINPESMSELRKELLKLSPDHGTIPPYFQLLLTTTVENAVPGKSSLVAVRVIPR
jgi:hypothetical protein